MQCKKNAGSVLYSQLTNDQLFSISAKCQEILERLEQLYNCLVVSNGSSQYCKHLCEDCIFNFTIYKHPLFLFSDNHAIYIRVYQIKNLDLRKNLKKLLI